MSLSTLAIFFFFFLTALFLSRMLFSLNSVIMTTAGILFLLAFILVDIQVYGDLAFPVDASVLNTPCPSGTHKIFQDCSTAERSQPSFVGFIASAGLVVCCPRAAEIKIDYRQKAGKVCDKYGAEKPLAIVDNIAGGRNATLGEFPHMVAVGLSNMLGEDVKYECGGSLISEKFVLTAAHCAVLRDRKPTNVIVGRVSS